MAELQTLSVSAVGGLDKVSPPQVTAQNPGTAETLENYEPLSEGGYRKIKGYTHYSTIPDAYKDLPLRGVAYYKGIVVIVGTVILHSYNGATWYEVNKDGLSTDFVKDVDIATLKSKPRLGEGKVQTQQFLVGSDNILIITDDKSPPAILEFNETDNSYKYKEIVSSEDKYANLAGYRYVTKYKDHVVVAGPINDTGSIAISARFSAEDFKGGGSLGLKVTDDIVGLKTFRDYLYIFCRHSIYRVRDIDLEKQTTMLPVTTKVGCVDGNTIQEIGGDVLFLSDDGLRYLGATERIDDVSLNLVSAPVRPLTDSISVNQGPLSSVVLPEKAQYRLFYTNNQGQRFGLIGTLSPQGRFVWSTTSDMDVLALTDAHLDPVTGEYVVYQIGHKSGVYKVHIHDKGTTFDTMHYISTWRTHYFTMGDSNIRKSLHDTTVFLEADDKAEIELTVKFDYEAPQMMQPEPFYLYPIIKASRFGEGAYGKSIYGAIRYPLESLFLEGSGKWVQFVFKDNVKDNQVYIIRGFDVQFNVGGRI